MILLQSVLYTIALKCYFGAIAVLALCGHRKATLMQSGRRETLGRLRAKRLPQDRYIWIHASSLGEFEQGRPIIERIKAEHPEYKICLTFFSPSGYEVRHNYPLADLVCYLPFDTSKDLRSFIQELRPEVAIFVKYEFWLRTLRLLRQQATPTFLISAIFRNDQPFFKSWGGIWREALGAFHKIFVQNEESAQLLRGIGMEHVEVAGDTRMDRVIQICEQAQADEILATFAQGAHERGEKIFMVGSSWEADEEVYLRALLDQTSLSIVVVPHEITPSHLASLRSYSGVMQLYTHTTPQEARKCRFLVVDTMGLLASIYRYADIAYVGGGFGRGIHNTPEAAVYGIPLFFGPNHHKFMEAKGLIEVGGAKAIATTEELMQHLNPLLSDDALRQDMGAKAGAYIRQNSGATDRILAAILP